MKNPLKKTNKGLLIGAIAAGAAVAGGLSWLLFTNGGKALISRTKQNMKEQAADLAASVLSEQTGVTKDVTKPAAQAIIE
ncbi:hypothetical protein D0C36_20085 [Mucilaginibacter conchicola]|uniref:Uncharacterized protein n=1 Tax=Mucilaginibacter conchicola TaxID=2303333 RepID=A0A372NQY6_9SPHI|nr:hypothetical protein [Mucilaginibacter conchicola]RFZ91238.1 hypothetical protein D0C36_20085 [Mucilaginibacter conchicola]